MRSGIALSSRGGGADRSEGTVGGIPFKEDPNAPRPRSGAPVGGSARESKNDPEKRNVPPWRNCFPKTQTQRGIERRCRTRREDLPRTGRARWEDGAARSSP